MKPLDLTGKKFGRWMVLRKELSDKRGNSNWVCLCDCGKEKCVLGYSLKSGDSTSCGCFNKENASARMLIHGQNTSKQVSLEYTSWANMKSRCTNKNNESYRNYGGRGIIICDRWISSFENFYADMGDKPSPKHSIERIDVNGNYEPSNCCWATSVEQSRNQRVHRNNEVGICGISFHKNTQKFVVRIGVGYRVISIGYFETLEEAKIKRIEAKLKYWGKSS